MRQSVDIHREPLAYLRACGLEVSYDDNKIKLAPTTTMSEAVKRKVLAYVKKYRAEVMADLAEEEAEAIGHARRQL